MHKRARLTHSLCALFIGRRFSALFVWYDLDACGASFAWRALEWMNSIFAFLLLFALSAGALLADTITLNNGTAIEGRIIAQDAKMVRILTKRGEQVFLKTAIRRITYSEKKQTPEEIEKARLEEEKLKEQADKDAEAREAEKKEVDRLREENESLKADLARRNQTEKQAAEAARERYSRSGWPAIWRSAVLPGWGQYYRGDKSRGAAFMAAAGLSAYTLYRFNNDYRKTRTEFNKAQNLAIASAIPGTAGIVYGAFTTANLRRNEMHTAALRVNFVAVFLGALYLFSATDALFYRSENASLADRQASKPELTAVYTVRF